MALEVKLVKVGVNEEGTEYYVSDGTGVYQAASGVAFTAENAPNLFTAVGHGLITGSVVTLATDGTLPDPLDINTQYSVILVSVDTFKLATMNDVLSEIDITNNEPGGTHTFISGVNLGGYGTPNPERTDVALILLTRIQKSTGDVFVSIDTYDPESAGNWTIQIDNSDGVYESTLFALSKRVGGETDGDVVYSVADSQVQRFDDPVYTALTNEELWGEVNPGYDTFLLNDYIVINSTIIKNSLNKEVTEAYRKYTQKLCDFETVFAKQNDYNYIRTLLEGGVLLFCQGNYTLAQENIETLETYYNAL
jgi:hypothetical protein